MEKFLQLVNFYNQLTTIMSAICVKKGGIATENYVGRFFAADVLEFIIEYGRAANADEKILKQLESQFESVRDLTTPMQKPIHEMTLAEFEKIMNI